MDWTVLLDGPVSKEKANRIKNLVFASPAELPSLVAVFLGDDSRLCQNAAMALSKIGDEKPEMITPHIPQMIDSLQDNPIDAVKRNVIRLLQTQEIPESHQGILVNSCFDYLTNRKTAVAIRVFSMTVLSNITQLYPELKNELKLILTEEMVRSSAGFQSRAKKILQELNR